MALIVKQALRVADGLAQSWDRDGELDGRGTGWENPVNPPYSTENLGERFYDGAPSYLQANGGKAMDRIGRMAERVAAGDMPEWAGVDFIGNIDVSGTILRKFAGNYQGLKIWLLKGESKLYKDRFGWISAGWDVNPVREGANWVVKSRLSFAPASNGSFANEKFDEFKKAVPLSGEKDFALFGIEVRMLTSYPDDESAAREIRGVLSTHGDDIRAAKRFWKEQAVLFKKQFGGL